MKKSPNKLCDACSQRAASGVSGLCDYCEGEHVDVDQATLSSQSEEQSDESEAVDQTATETAFHRAHPEFDRLCT